MAERQIETFQARNLHYPKDERSSRSFIQRGLLGGCTLKEMERRRDRLFHRTDGKQKK